MGKGRGDAFDWLEMDTAPRGPSGPPARAGEGDSAAAGESGGEAARAPAEVEDRGPSPVATVPGRVTGTAPGAPTRRRRNRPKDPNALRNDRGRMMAGAYVRRDVRRRVDQALADPAVGEGEKVNYSLLVEGLLVRWLEEVGYPLEEGQGT